MPTVCALPHEMERNRRLSETGPALGATAIGEGTYRPVLPEPAWPVRLSPNPYATSSFSSTIECRSPAAIIQTLVPNMNSSEGSERDFVSPSPSCPARLSPHANRWHELVSARMCPEPHAIWHTCTLGSRDPSFRLHDSGLFSPTTAPGRASMDSSPSC